MQQTLLRDCGRHLPQRKHTVQPIICAISTAMSMYTGNEHVHGQWAIAGRRRTSIGIVEQYRDSFRQLILHLGIERGML